MLMVAALHLLLSLKFHLRKNGRSAQGLERIDPPPASFLLIPSVIFERTLGHLKEGFEGWSEYRADSAWSVLW